MAMALNVAADFAQVPGFGLVHLSVLQLTPVHLKTLRDCHSSNSLKNLPRSMYCRTQAGI